VRVQVQKPDLEGKTPQLFSIEVIHQVRGADLRAKSAHPLCRSVPKFSTPPISSKGKTLMPTAR
jgi:hypothetical protein